MRISVKENNKPQINADERRLNDTVQPPQRTQRTQSIATTIFATFALWYEKVCYRCFFIVIYEPQFIANFAVRFICHLNLPLDNTIEAIGGT